MAKKSAYAKAGADIVKADRFVGAISKLAQSTSFTGKVAKTSVDMLLSGRMSFLL